jgi:Mrp family chromosome partitioning ATPase
LAPQDAHGEVIIPTATARLHVLPRGRSEWPAHAQAAKITQLFDELAHEYAWILVAGGETTSVPMQALARACRGAYVVAPLGETDLAVAQQSLASLHTAGARVLGAIALNK